MRKSRKSIMPDVSPRPREDFSVRDRTIAIMIVAAFVALITLGIGAFSVRDTESVKNALAEVEQQKADQLATFTQKMSELDIREQKLDARETAIKKREAALSEQETALEAELGALADEKALFYSGQLRVYELSKALYEELTPYYEPTDPATSE